MRMLIARRTYALLMSIMMALCSLAMLPEPRCASGQCVQARGHLCWDGTQLLEDYKLHIGFDG